MNDNCAVFIFAKTFMQNSNENIFDGGACLTEQEGSFVCPWV